MALESGVGIARIVDRVVSFLLYPRYRYGMKFRSLERERERLKNKSPSINPDRVLGTKLAIN